MDSQLGTPSTHLALAGFADLPQIAALAPNFYEEGHLPGHFHAPAFIATWTSLIAQGLGYIIIARKGDAVVGALGFFSVPDPNNGELTAQEAFWFVLKEHRGVGLKLLNKYEEAAKVLGAKRIGMAHIVGLMDEGLKKIFERRGYKAIEVHYWRDV